MRPLRQPETILRIALADAAPAGASSNRQNPRTGYWARQRLKTALGEVDNDSMDSDVLYLVVPLALVVLVFMAGPFLLRGLLGRILNGSKQEQERLEQLTKTGDKAHATILSVQSTGTVVNRVYFQCDLHFRLSPLDGSEAFEGHKTTYVPVTEMPRVGDVWPAWYDRDDRTAFSVGRPTADDPQMRQYLKDFGLPNPYEAARSGSSS